MFDITFAEVLGFIIPLSAFFFVLSYNKYYKKNRERNIPILVTVILLYKILLKKTNQDNKIFRTIFGFEFLASFLLIYTILLTGIGISNVLAIDSKPSIFGIFMLPPLMLYMLLTSSIYISKTTQGPPLYGALITPYPAFMVKVTNIFYQLVFSKDKQQLHGPPFNTDSLWICLAGTICGGFAAALIFAGVNNKLAT
jgi:hypothetical protein